MNAFFIYADQDRGAQDFAKLLKPCRINTQIVAANDLDEKLFIDEDLIIIGPDTFRVWGSKAADNVIRKLRHARNE